MSYEIRHLRYFVAVAEELHFGRASARLHIAQPALSRQIMQLEEILSVALFIRTKRSVRLTDAGKMFLAQARLILKNINAAAESARRVHEGRSGHIKIGFIASVSYTLLPPILRSFSDQYPNVQIDLQLVKNNLHADALKRREIDIGILRSPFIDPLLTTCILVHEPLVAAIPANHKLAGHSNIAIGLLKDEAFVMVPKNLAPFFELIRVFCNRAGFEPRVVQEADEIHTVIGIVSAGIGIALVPSSSQKMQIENVVYRDIIGAPYTEMLLAQRKDDASPIVSAFTKIANEVCLDSVKLLPASPRY